MSTALDLIKSSLRCINALASGEAPTNDEAQDSLRILNEMLDAWTAERLMIFTTDRQVFPLIAGQQDYTFGLGGDFNAPRPAKIDQASIIQISNPLQPLEQAIQMFTDQEWQELPIKLVPSQIPCGVYDSGEFPLRTLSYWGIPGANLETALYTWQALTQPSLLKTTIAMPPGYAEAMRYNLAVRLAPEFGATVTQELATLAQLALARVKTINLPVLKLSCDDAVLGGYGDMRYVRSLFGLP